MNDILAAALLLCSIALVIIAIGATIFFVAMARDIWMDR